MDNETPERREPRGARINTGPRAHYVAIKYGCLCETSKTPIEGWTEHKILDETTGAIKQVKWINIFRDLEIWVNELKWFSREWSGTEYSGWKMFGSAGDENYVVDFLLDNIATKRLMMIARNIDFNEPLEISAWTDEKENLAVNFKQNGQKVDQYYKKGDMKECPTPTVKNVLGKNKWDWDATNDFLWREMNEVITPAVLAASSQRGYVPIKDQVQQEPQPTEPDYSGPPQNSDPVATSLGEMLTSRQLNMIRALSRENNLHSDDECKALMGCTVGELSKRAASDLIEHLQAIQGGEFKPLTPLIAAEVNQENPTRVAEPQSVTTPTPTPVTPATAPPPTPASPTPIQAATGVVSTTAAIPAPVGAAEHGSLCKCARCDDIPF